MNITDLLKAESGSYDNGEWTGLIGGEEVTLYARPLSPADETRITKKFPNFMQNPGTAGMAFAIALKAVDADGSKVFSVAKDLPLLNRLKMELIADIFGGLFGDQVEEYNDDDDEAVRKNSKTTSSD